MTAADGLQLFARAWEPEGKNHAVICLIHGIGEHTGRYTYTAEAFTKTGYVLTGFDLRGHGLSHGQRGHAPSYEILMDDITCLLNKSMKRYPGQPHFLYGHSLGGNLVLNYALRRHPDLAGIIATAPDLGLAFKPPAWKIVLGNIMNNLWPTLSQTTGLDNNALSHDRKVIEAYKNDPLVHNRISARMFVKMRQAALWAQLHASQFLLPLLLMHGTGDRLTSAESSREFARQITGDCTFKLWQGLYHELHNEPEKKEIMKYIIRWVKIHTPV